MPEEKVKPQNCETCHFDKDDCGMPVPCCEVEDYFGKTVDSLRAVAKTFLVAQTQLMRTIEKSNNDLERAMRTITLKEEAFKDSVGQLKDACNNCIGKKEKE